MKIENAVVPLKYIFRFMNSFFVDSQASFQKKSIKIIVKVVAFLYD